MWRRVGEAVRAHHAWIRGTGNQQVSPGREDLESLGATLGQILGARLTYPGPTHLIDLSIKALRATERRALRRISGVGSLDAYVRGAVADRPLLWPGAQTFADRCVENLDTHVAVAIPTGSGKSAIAELAVARALQEGWCLYLAPTNALVGQIRRDLREPIERAGGEVRSFVGGGEYTPEEQLDQEVGPGQVLVMTPEKCALALRQSPELFASLRLFVLDECHLIGSSDSRGVVVELVVAEVLSRSSIVSALLMSALVSNAAELADWLASATDRSAIAIEEPWRPTRTLRGVVGIAKDEFDAAKTASESDLSARPRRVSRHQVPLSTMVGLQGAWATTGAIEDFAVVGLPASVEAQFRTSDPEGDVESWRNRAAEALTAALAATGEHVLTFVPANKHEVITVGREVATSMPERELEERVSDHLALAEYELGRESEVKQLLRNGVATHSAALIDDERRASELAFSGRNPSAPVIVATTSLAQGLNLPATVVVVAGTQIGRGRQGQTRTARDLLNAIGRAGRPFVANRSLALIVPSSAALLPRDAPPANVLNAARFIGLEDAAVALESQLVSLLRQPPERLAFFEGMTVEEITAFTYLPLGDDEAETAIRILQASLGHYQRRLDLGPTLAETRTALAALGTRFLETSASPSWLVEVAYVSGIDLRAVAALHRAVRDAPKDVTSTQEWADTLITWTEGLPPTSRELLCDLKDVPDPLAANLRATDPPAWERLRDATRGYLRGESLSEIGQRAFESSRDDGRRSSGDPLPKTIALVRQLLELSAFDGSWGAICLIRAGTKSRRSESRALARGAGRARAVATRASRGSRVTGRALVGALRGRGRKGWPTCWPDCTQSRRTLRPR